MPFSVKYNWKLINCVCVNDFLRQALRCCGTVDQEYDQFEGVADGKKLFVLPRSFLSCLLVQQYPYPYHSGLKGKSTLKFGIVI